MLERAARLYPRRLAVSDGTTTATFAELRDLAAAIAGVIERAAEPPGPIAFLLNSPAHAAATLCACAVAGRVCLALDPADPVARNRDVVANARAALVLVDSPDSPDLGVATLSVRDLPPELAGALRSRLDPGDVAFLIATSGSTGRPKLIALSSHAALLRSIQLGEQSKMAEMDRVYPGVGAIGSFPGCINFFTGLAYGAETHVIDVRQAGLRGLVERIRRERITVLRAAPSLWRAIADLDGIAHSLRHLRLVRFAGEGPLWADIDRIRQIVPPGCVFLNAYNATEAPGLYWLCTEADRTIDPLRVPAGWPAPSDAIRIVDENGQACARGEMGELMVLSNQIAAGEWREGRLVPNRIERDPMGSGLAVYRTGDLAREIPNGAVVVLGRADRMVKLNGLRVELAEIEAALRALPGVNDAAVISRDGPVGPTLIGWIEPSTDAVAVAPASLREALRDGLPAHMIPSRLHVLPSLPRLPSGKVDLETLKALRNL